PPPRSYHSPYSTLFRSLAARRGRPALIGGRAPCCDLTGRPCSRHVGGKIRTWLFGRDTPAAHRKRLFGSVHHEMGGALEVVPERDRKSTRLNSSHVKIS